MLTRLGRARAAVVPYFAVLGVAFGRLSGDRLALRFGAVRLMRCCGLVAAGGLTLALLSGNGAGAIAGFTSFGGGLSSTFPLLLSAAGNADPARPATALPGWPGSVTSECSAARC